MNAWVRSITAAMAVAGWLLLSSGYAIAGWAVLGVAGIASLRCLRDAWRSAGEEIGDAGREAGEGREADRREVPRKAA